MRCHHRSIAKHACIAALGMFVLASPASSASLSFHLPPGHTAAGEPPTGSYSELFQVQAKGDSDAGCLVGFQKVGATGITQDQLNAIAAKPEYMKTVQAFMGLQFAISSMGPFEQSGIRGVVATGDAKGAPMRMLFVIMETPRGRTTIACVGPAPKFAVLRPEFEGIVRGVVVPR